ncbi:SusD/RagB family nutrient-binding outer membrane lipoprotein [Sphingobacterium sp.]|uniref:SusD/RagB family nutrient-binding outer membrane lipoprotein n=1 Tax=Sphingobacterium sp. TaxID=341027 RepID=UPI0028AF898E|nr:SusD/RagB family nutrient-binding outer membrane lipoprotein [Sphingobacterium sp.]
MKLNKIKTLSILLGSVLLLTNSSCSKYLDINTSPLTATEVEPKLLFGYAVTAWDANKNSGDAWMPLSLEVQSMASGGNYGWGTDNLYNISTYALGNTFKVYYSTGGNNLKQAIKIAEEASPKQNNAAAQCKIVLAQLIYEATTLYGDVPFSEAWVPEISYPKYDSQKDVLNGVLALLDEAIGQIDESSTLKISDYDIYYSGDLQKWKKLANSIKFKVYMVMADADPSVATKIGDLLKDESVMISSSSDSWVHKYYTTENNENPKYRLFKTYTNGENQWFFANSNIYDYMDPKDPRIPKYFDKGPKATTYKAVGSEELADETTSLISGYLYRKDAPSLILSYHELTLLKAEAYARGLGVSKDLSKANTLFKEGVKAACLFYGVANDDASTFVNNTLKNLTTVADPLKEIHLQQWIDLMDRPMEGFVQWRRSGNDGNEVPKLTVPPGATAGPLIRRWTLSPDEISANPNIPNPAPKYYDKVWFDL